MRDRRKPMPIELEIGWLVEDGGVSLKDLGFDPTNPKFVRGIRMAVNVYNAASERRKAKKKSEWDKENKDLKEFLDWASGVEEVMGEQPTLPKREKK